MLKVVQCWDDNPATDARLVDILRKYHAKATFNIIPGYAPEVTVPKGTWHPAGTRGWTCKGYTPGRIGKNQLKELYTDFQVASHGWNHRVATLTPLKEFVEDAMSARKFLEDLFQRPCTGYAWPCGGTTQEAADALRELGFEYGRSTMYTDNVSANTDPLIMKTSCHFQDTDFWNKYDAAKKNGGIFYFWGHSYETFDLEPFWEQIEGKIRMISEDPEAEWCDVIDIARQLKK